MVGLYWAFLGGGWVLGRCFGFSFSKGMDGNASRMSVGVRV